MQLREARLERKLTLREAAKAVDTDVANLSRIERGQMPNKDLARRLVEYFNPLIDYSAFFQDPPAGIDCPGADRDQQAA